jgi:hypothetical protein
MKFLDCIELLDAVLAQLRDGKRDPIPVRKIPGIEAMLAKVPEAAEGTGLLYIPQIIGDVIVSLDSYTGVDGIEYVPPRTKERICDELRDVRLGLAQRACSYYKNNDFEPTERVIPLMIRAVNLAFGRVE